MSASLDVALEPLNRVSTPPVSWSPLLPPELRVRLLRLRTESPDGGLPGPASRGQPTEPVQEPSWSCPLTHGDVVSGTKNTR